jgi:hypothetical protein
MKIIKAPNKVDFNKPTLFLSGSIEMGKATNWQNTVIRMIKNWGDWDGTILNPRRDDWDSSWVQNIENKKFREQVEWELEGLKWCDYVFMLFDPNTKSPITLMELGMMANKKNMIVVCGSEFWRAGNVQVFCAFYGIPLFDRIEEAVEQLCRGFLRMKM